MRSLPALAVILLAGCAAELAPTAPPETTTVGRSITVVADDGTTFDVSIVHHGSVTSDVEEDIVTSVGVEVVPEGDRDDIGVAGQFVPPVDPRLVPTNGQSVQVIVTAMDPDVLTGNYRWDWIDDIDAEDIQTTVELLCPPWH